MKRTTWKGFTLVELMVVIGVIALLAALAIPSYSFFRKKAAVGSLVKELGGMTQILQSHYLAESNFNGLALDANSNIFSATGVWVANLPPNNSVDWSITQSTANQLDITWTFRGACNNCNGVYCVFCDDQSGCSISFFVQEESYGLNRNPNNINCTL